MSTGDLRSLLSEPARIRALTQCVRAKIPPHDVDDVVQSTLADALAAASPPLDESALERWLNGIARHKVADYYRSHRRHELADGDIDRHDAPTDGHAESTRDLLHWVNGELPADSEAPRTLEWMMREADGDRLESIAAENNLTAPAVRQRVSRLRRYLKERWALQLAAAVTLVLVVGVGVYAYKTRGPAIEPEPTARVETPAFIAQKLRQSALADCRSGHWRTCLEQLDHAKVLDPAGDNAQAVAEARADIARALQPTPLPSPSTPEDRLVPAGEVPTTIRPKTEKTPAPLHSQGSNSTPNKPTKANSQSSSSEASSNAKVNSSTATPTNTQAQSNAVTLSYTQAQSSAEAVPKVQSAKAKPPAKAISKGSPLDFGNKQK